MTDQIFISYSKKDSDFVHKLADDLEAAGFKIWIDKSISGGDHWRQTIEQNLKAARQVIIVVSPNSMASEWVRHEGSLAYGWGKQLFPILIEPVDALPPWLEEYQWIDFVNTSQEIAFNALVAALTPPDPYRIILDQHFYAYQQTKALIGETNLRAIEENLDLRTISDEKRILLEQSQREITRARRKSQRFRATGLLVIGLAVVLAMLGISGYLNRFYYRPLPMNMIEIEAGEFIMGSATAISEEAQDELPQRTVYLDAYKIGEFEVTNREYIQCIKANICSPLAFLELLQEDQMDHPITYVNWEDANAFCRWYDYRLPTEAEWEKAARGTDGRIFPWGDQMPDCSLANFNNCNQGLTPVGQYPASVSPYELQDMAGNVWEWVADWYIADYYARAPAENPPGPDGPGANSYRRVVRGGSYYYGAEQIRTANRRPNTIDTRNQNIGFRCAQDMTP